MRMKVPQGSALARLQAASPGFRATLVQPSASLRTSVSLQVWAIPPGLTLASPGPRRSGRGVTLAGIRKLGYKHS